MSHRRGAPSMDKECVLRRMWYAEAQKKEFRGSDSSSEDEMPTFEEINSVADSKSTGDDSDDASKEGKFAVEEKPALASPPPSRQHQFSNFASTLGAESRYKHSKVILYSIVMAIFPQQSNRKGPHRRKT